MCIPPGHMHQAVWDKILEVRLKYFVSSPNTAAFDCTETPTAGFPAIAISCRNRLPGPSESSHPPNYDSYAHHEYSCIHQQLTTFKPHLLQSPILLLKFTL